MRCPICGREAEAEQNICPKCGTDFAVLEESRKAVIPSISAQAPQQIHRKRWVVITSAALAGLLVIGILLSVLLPQLTDVDEGYVIYTTDIRLGSTSDAIAISINGNILLDDLVTNLYHQPVQRSLDGSVCAYLRNDNGLKLISGDQEKIDHFVDDFLLSTEGSGLLYKRAPATASSNFTKQLYYYTPDTGAQCIVENFYSMYFLDWCISPDGKCFAYTYFEDINKPPKLMFYDGKLRQLASGIYDLHGMSNDGKYIYGSQRNGAEPSELFCINSKGSKKSLGSFTEDTMHLNADHTQILFYRDHSTYLSTKGGKPHKLAEGIAAPLMPSNTQAVSDYYVTTQPAKDLYNKVYLINEGSGLVTTSAWYMGKHDQRMLVSPVDHCSLDSTGKYLYYLQGRKLQYLSVTNSADGPTLLTSDVKYNRFCLNANSTSILYTSDKTVQTCSATVPDIIQIEPFLFYDGDTVPQLASDGEGNFYYAINNRLYFTGSDMGAVHVLDSEILSLESSPNGYVYIRTPEYTYLASAGAPPTILWKNSNRVVLT